MPCRPFHAVVAVILGDYAGDEESRQDLLSPVRDQQQRIARYVSRRGEIPQVDPESGEPTEPVAENPEDESSSSDAANSGTSTGDGSSTSTTSDGGGGSSSSTSSTGGATTGGSSAGGGSSSSGGSN